MRVRHSPAIIVVVSCLLMVACGGSKDKGEVRQDGDAKLRACLEKSGQGSSIDDVEVRRSADPAFAKALDSCQASLGVGSVDKSDGANKEVVNKQLVGVLACLRDAGWDVPQPTKGASGYLSVQRDLNENVPPNQQGAFAGDLQRCGGPPPR